LQYFVKEVFERIKFSLSALIIIRLDGSLKLFWKLGQACNWNKETFEWGF